MTLAAAAVVFGLGYYWFQSRVPDPSARPDDLTTVVAVPVPAAPTSPHAVPRVQPAGEGAAETAQLAKAGAPPRERAANPFDNPEVQKILAKSTAKRATTRFRPLLDQLALSDEDRTRFVVLVTEHELMESDLRVKLVIPGTSKGERAALLEQLKKVGGEQELIMRGFFNDEAKYAAYQDYLAHEPSREEVGYLNRDLENRGVPLSRDQATDLARLTFEIRSGFAYTNDVGNLAQITPETLANPVIVDRYFTEMEILHAKVQARAAAVLTPTQLTALKAQHESKVNLLRRTFEKFGNPR